MRRRAAAGRADRAASWWSANGSAGCRTTCRPYRWPSDLAAQQRRLRLKPEALERALDLDLRKEIDLRRSRLLHRLRAIGVPWGEPDAGRRGTGTFREEWRLRWQPEFAVSLVEGSMSGTTVAAAATAKVTGAARDGRDRSPR